MRAPFRFESDAPCRTQMHLARSGVVSPEMQRVAEREQLARRARPRRGRARADDHPRQRPPRRAGSDGDRPQGAGEDQREHRQLADDVVAGRGGRQAAPRRALGRRHGHGPLDRQAHRRDAAGDPRRRRRADRHRADLPGDGGPAPRRGAHGRAAAGDDRAPGAPGRRLHDDPRRRAARAPAALPAPRHRDRLARRRPARALDGPAPPREPALRALRRDPRDLPRARRVAVARRRPAAGLHRRRLRRRPVRRARRRSAS